MEFLSEEDADYAIKIMNMIKLYGKPIRVNKASAHNKNLDVGANIFIGNLDPEIDEKLLYDTFSAFGVILQTPKIMRDPDTGNSKGYAFINFASFDASDAAIEAMNGQYLCNRPITVSYAFKKDSKGERHGSAAERLLAAQNPLSQADRPHQLFADAPPPPSAPTPVLTAMGAGMPIPGKKEALWFVYNIKCEDEDLRSTHYNFQDKFLSNQQYTTQRLFMYYTTFTIDIVRHFQFYLF